MGCGGSSGCFFLSVYLLKSRTFKTINTIAATRNKTWKKLIIANLFWLLEITFFDDNVSSNYTIVFPPGRAALSRWLRVRIH